MVPDDEDIDMSMKDFSLPPQCKRALRSSGLLQQTSTRRR